MTTLLPASAPTAVPTEPIGRHLPDGAGGAALDQCARAGGRTGSGLDRRAPRLAEPRRSQRRPIRPRASGRGARLRCLRRGGPGGRRRRSRRGHACGGRGVGGLRGASRGRRQRVGRGPPSADLAEVAALPVAGLAALRALRAAGPVLGKRVLITGASGGVGRFAVQLAAHAGGHVIASVGSLARGEGLAQVGAEEVVVGLHRLERGTGAPKRPERSADDTYEARRYSTSGLAPRDRCSCTSRRFQTRRSATRSPVATSCSPASGASLLTVLSVVS
jgi:hypothetical protein